MVVRIHFGPGSERVFPCYEKRGKTCGIFPFKRPGFFSRVLAGGLVWVWGVPSLLGGGWPVVMGGWKTPLMPSSLGPFLGNLDCA